MWMKLSGQDNKSKDRPPVNNFGSPGAQARYSGQSRVGLSTKNHSSKSNGGQVQGQVTFDAVVRHTEKRPSFIRRNVPEKDLWFYTDITQMAEKYGTLPILVDACYGTKICLLESSIQGGPIGGQTRVNHRNDHMMYACFWFSIGAATLFGWLL
uniref:SURF1-like protein n=1 Tax=Loa loa TaxID=7209 RepID=A0A1I7VT41_LOALO